MAKFILIEVDENSDLEDQAEHVKRVSKLVDDGFICGIDDPIRFETIATVNHQSIGDAVKAIRQNDK